MLYCKEQNVAVLSTQTNLILPTCLVWHHGITTLINCIFAHSNIVHTVCWCNAHRARCLTCEEPECLKLSHALVLPNVIIVYCSSLIPIVLRMLYVIYDIWHLVMVYWYDTWVDFHIVLYQPLDHTSCAIKPPPQHYHVIQSWKII